MPSPEFDRYARTYDRDLANALSVTGESKDYYAQARVDWLAMCLVQLNIRVERVLDFGCGIGSNSPILSRALHPNIVLGVDISKESIEEAEADYGSETLRFMQLEEFRPDGSYDLAFANGVFHHIEPKERAAALTTIREALRPRGFFALWENNPWNPGTKYVMSRCVFDKGAITISISAARKMLREAGFEVLRTDSLFYFPRSLRLLRPLEKCLRGLPLGGQYLVLARKA
ncbi:MAG: class I SAM-dependent methyltransferase [Terriglobales bacterium]